MGLFDYVIVNDSRFVCSEGHDLRDEEFQTHDLGETMGTATIEDGRITMRDGGWGEAEVPGLIGTIEIYCTCRRCPAFVQDKTANLVPTSIGFDLVVKDDVIAEITRTSPNTEEWLVSTPAQPWMANCLGPMTYEEAQRIRRDGIGAWTRQRADDDPRGPAR